MCPKKTRPVFQKRCKKFTYLKCLLDKVENLIRHMRWKAYFYYNKNETENTVERFGVKSTAPPPINQHLANFENDLYEMIRKIEFQNVNNEFLKKLKKDIKTIQSSSNVFISADKTNNLYEIPITEYNKLLKENITKSYEKCENPLKHNINKEAKKIATTLI